MKANSWFLQVGPRDLEKHSKLPYWMQMHGSVLPRMILPMAMIAGWSTLITCLHKFVVGRMFPHPIPNLNSY